MRKLRKDERVCKMCGKIFRLAKNKGNQRHCSKKCSYEGYIRRNKHRESIGTPVTLSLSEKSVKKELKRIRENKDNKHLFSGERSKREVILQNTAYKGNSIFIYNIEEYEK